jgi:hypothetical protein
MVPSFKSDDNFRLVGAELQNWSDMKKMTDRKPDHVGGFEFAFIFSFGEDQE